MTTQRIQTFQCTACGNQFRTPIMRSFSTHDMTREPDDVWDYKWDASQLSCPFNALRGAKQCGKTIIEITGRGRGGASKKGGIVLS